MSRKATKEIFEDLIPLLLNEDFEEVSAILDNLDISNIKGKLLVSYLSATNPWKNGPIKDSRNRFLEEVKLKLIEEIGDKRTIEILKGLRQDE